MASILKRTAADGTVSYLVRIRLRGHPPVTQTLRRLTDAKCWAAQTETAIREGRFFAAAEARRHTAGDLIDRYVRDVLPNGSSDLRNRRRQLEWWRREIGHYALADVTPALLAERRDTLLNEVGANGKRRAPATVVRYLAALSHVLSVAVKEWGWLDDNPMGKVRKPAEPRGRVRFLSDEERGRLLEACKAADDPTLYPIVVLALATGMRQGEIMGLTWADVDFERGRVVLHNTKNGERRAPPLSPHVREVLAEWAKVRRLDTPLVFPRPTKGAPTFPHRAWARAVAAAELEDFRFHDLRHSCASYLAMNGASLMEIAEVLGHKTLAMVRRYAHLSDGHTAGVVERMNARIFGAGELA